jgi:hypothetical protein
MTGPQDSERVSSLRELPQAIEPPRDLWPQIEASLDTIRAAAPPAPGKMIPMRRSAVRLRWLAAAAMVASVAVGVWIGRSLLPGGGVGPQIAGRATPTNVSPAAPGSGTLVAPPAVTDVGYVNDPRYQRQRAALLRSLQAQLATLPPETRDKVTTSLAAIEKAKEDLEQALGKDPGNALLQELLVNTYQDEMRVLTDVHEASNSGRGI